MWCRSITRFRLPLTHRPGRSPTEKVLLQVRSSTDTIVFNSLNETLHDVRLDGKPVKTIDSNDDKQLTTLTLNSPAASGRHTLTFSYDGKMEAGPRGMFAQPYIKPDGGRGLRVSTKFESTDARSCTPLPRQRPARRSSDATIRR
jgi:aminopeptidase N